MKRTTVIGSGRWGSFLAWYSASCGHETILYGRPSSKRFKELKSTRRNEYLELPDAVELCDDINKALAHSDYLLIAISSQALSAFCEQLAPDLLAGTTMVLCMKGLEQNTGTRLTRVVQRETRGACKLAVWLGPGHVQDFVQDIPNCMVIDSEDVETTSALIEMYSSPLIRLYIGQDLIGNELGAATKNVIGLAAGMLDGLELSALKGALMSRGSREMSRLIKVMGGDEQTVYGLAHLGDYQATLFSEHSKNREFGEKFVTNTKFEGLAEGLPTLNAVIQLAKSHDVDLPICKALYNILTYGYDPGTVLKELLLRPVKSEL
ncbi:MAG: NAD(P)H-dependent glycerol-3-phosphate dehydrogenase [Bacteroides sp.]|nr:NAD(P)H-dependent glycerol-3-phosphate dehydrogenase [Bacteroides sp.]